MAKKTTFSGSTMKNAIRLSDDAVLSRRALTEAEETLRSGTAGEPFTLAQARDLLGCPRKQAQQIMEYFDLTKRTRWDGEARHWLPSPRSGAADGSGKE